MEKKNFKFGGLTLSIWAPSNSANLSKKRKKGG